MPLKVFGPDDAYIRPQEVTEKLRGALVEVYFTMKHYYIGGGDTKYNSFTGSIEQIIILRYAASKTPSPFWMAGRKGPFRPQLMDIKPMAPLVWTEGSQSISMEEHASSVSTEKVSDDDSVGNAKCGNTTDDDKDKSTDDEHGIAEVVDDSKGSDQGNQMNAQKESAEGGSKTSPLGNGMVDKTQKDSAEGGSKSLPLGNGIVLKLNVGRDQAQETDEMAKEGRTTRSTGKQKATEPGDHDAKRRKVGRLR
ncbi:hypothetical protein H0H93_010770 [Arthromyces matolae]|nr:hypothetical protein H0H93_010770 [Arthromyces matolae]